MKHIFFVMNNKQIFGSAGTQNQPSIDNSKTVSDTGISDLVLEASHTKKRSMDDCEDLIKKAVCRESGPYIGITRCLA